MEINIRPARPDDIPRMCELLDQLFTLESDFEPNIEKQVKGLSLLMTGTAGTAGAFVAVTQGQVIGMATVQALVSTAEGGRVGLVEDVVVDKNFLCRNVGTRLIEGIVSWSRKQGFTRLQLLADRDNHQALNFYTSRGLTRTRLICLREKL